MEMRPIFVLHVITSCRLD